ncbi:MAG: cyclic nucleotide-binding domain-containing protein, partial [Gammaproteobacteria bacterium]
SDGLIHYLIDGEVDLLDHGRLAQRLHPRNRIARRPLDEAGPKRYTARSYSPCTIACLARVDLERASESTRLPGSVQELAASCLVDGESGDWMARIMDSDLFKVLPNHVIQSLFEAMETQDVQPDDVVIRQGDRGEYFYVVERGFLECTRRAGEARQEVHVVDIRPGDTFGEAALIAGNPRDATVTALTDGRLLRLSRVHFDTLIATPLLHGVGAQEAVALCREGARWLDVSDPEIYAKAPLRNSRNIPLNALRAQSARLNRGDTYVVCSDEAAQAAVGAYVLAERGFKTYFLRDSIVMLIADNAGLALAIPVASASNVIAFPLPDALPATSANPEGIV